MNSEPLIAVFVDLKKAFDSIPKHLQWRVHDVGVL